MHEETLSHNLNLDLINIVMVGTTHPGNIGAAARAMNNMSLSNLVLVDPQCPVGEIAYSRSSGAHFILDKRKTVNSLSEAIEDCGLVIGMSARPRSLAWPMLKPDELVDRIQASGDNNRVALVFGREHSGLSNEELSLCHAMVSIPTNPDFSSLNVASAIQIICYEIFKDRAISPKEQADKRQTDKRHADKPDEMPATSHEMEGYYSHLEQVLIATEFLDRDKPGLLMQRLRRLFQRAGVNKTEVNILRGILTSVRKFEK